VKVLHISPSFYPAAHYGGTIYSGHALCNSLAQIPEITLRVLTTDSDGPTGGQRIPVDSFPTSLPEGYEVYYCRTRFGADISPRMLALLWPMIGWADVVHLTAVYSPPTIPTLLFSKLMNKPVIWSTRGALQRWDGSTRRGIKGIWERVSNLLCNPGRVELHVTSEEEKRESTAIITRASATLIPNGIDLPDLNGHRSSRTGELNALFLGRLHPIKGIENLLQAVANTDKPVRLSICGEGEPEYVQHLRSLANELSIASRVDFLGRVDGHVKEEQFQKADFCIVPSFKENFCIVIAESLARGVPVIASTGAPWPGLQTNDCGLWVNNDPEELAKSINLAATLPLEEMGKRGRAWMERDYSWANIAKAMSDRYRSLINYSSTSDQTQVREAA